MPKGRMVLLALAAGVVLAVMTDWNSQLARHSSPLFASWAAHGIGMVASMVLVMLLPSARIKAENAGSRRWPLWSYLGGIPGAFTVLLAAITVNSPLGLAGTLALLLVGQIAFSVIADHFGMFCLERRPLALRDLVSLALVSGGSIVIIAARS